MKQKLTLLLLALVTSMGAWAQASITVDTSSPLQMSVKLAQTSIMC